MTIFFLEDLYYLFYHAHPPCHNTLKKTTQDHRSVAGGTHTYTHKLQFSGSIS